MPHRYMLFEGSCSQFLNGLSNANSLIMENPRKRHHTEIIIALITAVTGLSVALIANWDKIRQPEIEPQKEQKKDITADAEKFLTEGTYSLIAQGYIEAKSKVKQGWEIEHFSFANFLRDTISHYHLELIAGYTYEFQIFSLDSTCVANVFLRHADENLEDLKLTFEVETSMSVNLEDDIQSVFISIKGKKSVTPIGFIISSRKT